MTAARRLLLAAGGGGSFTLPPSLFAITTPDDGGWTHANNPSAIEHDGYLYVGYVDMASGNVGVRSMLLSPPYTVSSAVVISAALEADTHAAPSLFVRSDGKLLVVYSKHDGPTMYRRISTNALPDISAFGSETSLDASLTGLDYTYPVLVRYGSDIWMFYRDYQGAATSVLVYSVSTDEGATWSAQTEVYKSSTRESYWMVDSTGSRIDIVTSDGRNPPDSDPVTISHFYYDGTWRKSDGTSAGSLPLDPSDLTEVYDASDGMGWPFGIVAGVNPVFVYGVLDSPSTNSWRRAKWNGSAWVNSTIASSNGEVDTGFAGSCAIDRKNTDHVYCPVFDGSHFQLVLYVYSGGTWTGTPVTDGTVDNLNPKSVYGSTGFLRVVWQSGGPYVSYLDGGFGISGARGFGTTTEEEPPPEGDGFYIAPTGNDSTGDGSIGNPWATMQKFVEHGPAAGDTLYCRGGDYPYVDDTNPGFRNARDTWPSLIGTADSPITIRNYPGETVNITGVTDPCISIGPNDTSHTVGSDYVVIDGINFPGSRAIDAAAIVVGGFDATGYYTKHVTIRNCTMSMTSPSDLIDHAIGIIHGVDGVTIEDCVFEGPFGSGGNANAIDIYSEPAALNVVVQRCIFNEWAIALQAYDYTFASPVLTIQVLHNTFVGNDSAVDLRHHSTALVRNNAFSGANTGATSIYDPNDSADTTADHNFFSQTFDSDYKLVAGQSGRGAASDGTDAGALDW